MVYIIAIYIYFGELKNDEENIAAEKTVPRVL